MPHYHLPLLYEISSSIWILALAFAGLGLMLALLSFGTDVSTLNVRVIVVSFPAVSRALTTIVLFPSAAVNALENAPAEETVMLPISVPLRVAVTVTGLLVESFVVPDSVRLFVFVIRLFAGEEILNVGGTVSILNLVDIAVAELPSLSFTLIVIVCSPSARAVCGVYTNWNPLVIAVFTMPALDWLYVLLSILRDSVARFRPLPPVSSVTLKVICCLLLITNAPLVGDTSVITGFIVSFTVRRSDDPIVADAAL
nr:MAG TPA: hypothetical protein [Caudoviricetes sp.]